MIDRVAATPDGGSPGGGSSRGPALAGFGAFLAACTGPPAAATPSAAQAPLRRGAQCRPPA